MSKVTNKYQITIPASIRETLKIIPGSDVDIVPKGDDFVLKVNPVEKLKRVWKGRFKNGQSSDEYITDIRILSLLFWALKDGANI